MAASCLRRLLSHLSSKATQKKPNGPTAALEALERWSAGATVIILVAILVDAWATIHFQKPDETGVEVAIKVAADLAIGLALIIEALCIIRAIFETRKEKRESDERVAEANERTAETAAITEQLRFENLTLHRVMLPRHVGAIGFDGPPPAQTWFAGIGLFAGTDVLIQSASEAEAKNLANEIALVLRIFGWKSWLVDETKSHVSLALMEGVCVMSSYLDERPWTAEDLELVPYTKCAHAGDALARSLTAAGLAVGNFPLHCVRFASRPSDDDKRSGMIPWFDPPGPVVYVQVGARPIAATLQWLASLRKPAAPAKTENANSTAARETSI